MLIYVKNNNKNNQKNITTDSNIINTLKYFVFY